MTDVVIPNAVSIKPAVNTATAATRCLTIENNQQVTVNNSQTLTVNGDLEAFGNEGVNLNGSTALLIAKRNATCSGNISSSGKLQMGGSQSQYLNMNGNSIRNLQINNSTLDVILGGNSKITSLLEFTNGKLQLDDYDLALASSASFTGVTASKYVVTNRLGNFRKELSAAATINMPVGIKSQYTPVQYQVTGGTYGSEAFLGVRSIAGAHPNRFPNTPDYLNSFWRLTNANIAGATISATGTYVDPAGKTGTEANIKGMIWNGSSWALGTGQNATANTVSASITTSPQDLYGMTNKYLLVSPKVFLQGAFNTGTGLMNDLLRNGESYKPGIYPTSNLIPFTDPYRSAPYNTAFTHTSNSIIETIGKSVLKDAASPNDQIVDWVFVELRNKLTNTQAPVIQTRSALVQRDGDVVDLDGVSPVYFYNLDPDSNYVISIRHRNHLGISSNPANPLTLGMTTTTFDFTNTANTNIYGASGGAYATTAGKNLMWGGNANMNNNVRYGGPANDKDYLLNTVLSGLSGSVLTIYSLGDLNLNRVVRYGGPFNDRDYLLGTILVGNSAIVMQQLLPN